jgi:hypothetical protein
MELLQALEMLGSGLLTPLLLGALAAALAKAVWRRELAGCSWWRLAWPAAAAAAAAALLGLAWAGRDGRMATYALMVAACAFTLWWRGFHRGRR